MQRKFGDSDHHTETGLKSIYIEDAAGNPLEILQDPDPIAKSLMNVKTFFQLTHHHSD